MSAAKRRQVVLVTGALAALLAVMAGGAAAGGPAEAQVQVYNHLYPNEAIDAQVRLLAPQPGRAGLTVALAKGLKRGDEAGFVTLPAGKVRIEVRLPGAGQNRLLRRTMRLQPNEAYCVMVHGILEDRWITQHEVTRWARVDPFDGDLCEKLIEFTPYVPLD